MVLNLGITFAVPVPLAADSFIYLTTLSNDKDLVGLSATLSTSVTTNKSSPVNLSEVKPTLRLFGSDFVQSSVDLLRQLSEHYNLNLQQFQLAQLQVI